MEMEPGQSHLGQRVSATGCRIGGWPLDQDHPVQFLDGCARDRTGRILSRRVQFCPIQSHLSHPKADISPDSKLKDRSPDALEWNFFESCTILSRFVPPGPRGSAGRATMARGKCRDAGRTFMHWCHITMVRRRHKAWQAATVINCPNAIALEMEPASFTCHRRRVEATLRRRGVRQRWGRRQVCHFEGKAGSLAARQLRRGGCSVGHFGPENESF